MDIKTYRKAKKMTQAELAESIGVSRNAIARYESGDITPKTDKLLLLSEILEHDFISDLINSKVSQHISVNDEKTVTPSDLIEKIDSAIYDAYVFPHSHYFKDSFDRMGYEASYDTSGYNRTWTFKKDAFTSTPIDEKKIEALFSKFIEHMKIDFQSFLEEQCNGTEK